MSAPTVAAPTRRAPAQPSPYRPPVRPDNAPQASAESAVLKRTAIGLLTVLAAAIAWWRVYPPLSLPVPALSGILLGGAAIVLADRMTRSQSAVRSLLRLLAGVLGALVAGLITAMTVAVPRASSPAQAVTDVANAVTGGLARILTTTLPAPPAPDLLPQFAVLCALAAAATAVIARGRGGLALAAPSVCLLLTGLVCGVGGAGEPLWVSLPFVLTAGLLVLPRPGLVPVVVTLVVLSLGCVAGLALGGVTRDPADPRRLTPPPLRAEQPTAPMDELSGWLRHSGQTAFTAKVDSAWEANPQPWRIAALDTYDGIRWSSSTPAVPVGYDLPAPDAAGVTEAKVSITPEDLEGVYVPVSGQVTHLARPGMTYDLRGETLVDPEGLNGTYEQTVALRETDRTKLQRAAAGRTAPNDPSLALDGCTDSSILTLAQNVVASSSGRPLDNAVALERWFSNGSGLRLDPEATPGHSCGRVLELFSDGNGTGNGTPDQFATAYVLMARSLGLPARVAVGFEARRPEANGVVTVNFGDATAWPEVWFDGAGWVPFSATPDRTGSSKQQLEEEQQAEPPPSQPQPRPEDTTADQGPPQEGSVKQTGKTESDATDYTFAIVGAALVLTLLLLVPVVGALINGMRRRRRRAGGALGAWAELLDRLADHGHPSAGRTSLEIQNLLSGLAPHTEQHAQALSHLVDAEVYGGSRLKDDQAWNHLRQIENALKSGLPWTHRLARSVDPRPRRWA